MLRQSEFGPDSAAVKIVAPASEVGHDVLALEADCIEAADERLLARQPLPAEKARNSGWVSVKVS